MYDKVNIRLASIDCDPIAYSGSSSQEKMRYKCFKMDDQDIDRVYHSKVFDSAKDAKVFLSNNPTYERENFPDEPDLQKCLKATETVLLDYMNTAIRLTGNKDIEFIGFLTDSGIKEKDISGLEDRYQGNRSNTVKPKYLSECRDFLEEYKWIHMCSPGIEADGPVISTAEEWGYEGLAMSIDKDVGQVEECHFINMNYRWAERTLEKISKVGNLVCKSNSAGTRSVKGSGFKFVCYQAMAGDTADGYKGVSRYGPAKVFDILNSCKTKKECLQALLHEYENIFQEGHSYTSWDGKKVFKTPYELLDQHFQLAYMPRHNEQDISISRYI